MKKTILLVTYGRGSTDFPVLSGNSGVVYGKAVWNPGKRRHELAIDFDLWTGAAGRGPLSMERDVFNNMRRPGAQWTVGDIQFQNDEAIELRQQEKIERLEAENDALRSEVIKALHDSGNLKSENVRLSDMLLRATEAPEPPKADKIQEAREDLVEAMNREAAERPDAGFTGAATMPSIASAPIDVSGPASLPAVEPPKPIEENTSRRATLKDVGFRDLRSMAKGLWTSKLNRDESKFPPNPGKDLLINIILEAEAQPQ